MRWETCEWKVNTGSTRCFFRASYRTIFEATSNDYCNQIEIAKRWSISRCDQRSSDCRAKLRKAPLFSLPRATTRWNIDRSTGETYSNVMFIFVKSIFNIIGYLGSFFFGMENYRSVTVEGNITKRSFLNSALLEMVVYFKHGQSWSEISYFRFVHPFSPVFTDCFEVKVTRIVSTGLIV